MFQNIHIHTAKSFSVSLGKKPRLRGFAKPVFTIMFLPQHRHEDGQIETEDLEVFPGLKSQIHVLNQNPIMSIIQISLLKEKKIKSYKSLK